MTGRSTRSGPSQWTIELWALGPSQKDFEKLASVNKRRIVALGSGTTRDGLMRCICTVTTFWIKNRSGLIRPGQRDTYLFSRGEKATLILRRITLGWLFHCHMFEHHVAGMGAVIEVT